MQINTETFGDVLVAHTPDEVTEDTSPQFLDALSASIEDGQLNVVLQMDRSDQFDSVGLTSLVELKEKLRSVGGSLKISGLPETGKRVFEVTRLDSRFEIFDSVIDAVSSFR
ncbi:MAG: STAS domain-containing protein [Planctomycetota bacterium]|nr:STAS domain-containing protein [Planctomycetota bacterium]